MNKIYKKLAGLSGKYVCSHLSLRPNTSITDILLIGQAKELQNTYNNKITDLVTKEITSVVEIRSKIGEGIK